MATREREPEAGKAAAPQTPSALVNLDEIKELIDLIIEKGVSEFELERSGVRIKIARNSGPYAAAAPVPLPEYLSPPGAIAPAVSPQPGRGTASQSSSEVPRDGSTTVEELYVVRSPMVGTFYASPTQGAEPFVRVGDRVQTGQVLCIIEAMKLMNEIEAEVAGEVIKCYVENGQPVEYGEPLLDLRPFSPVKRMQ